MAKQTHYLVSDAWEAEEMIYSLMLKQDQLRLKRWEIAHKAARAEDEATYSKLFDDAIEVDNELYTLEKEILKLADFLPMPLI